MRRSSEDHRQSQGARERKGSGSRWGASAVLMPGVMLGPHFSMARVIVLFSMAFFGQQSSSMLVMILPTDS